MKKQIFSSLYAMTAVVVIFLGILQLYQSLYRKAAEAHLSNMTLNVSNIEHAKVTHSLSKTLMNFPLPLAYDLSLSATLFNWLDYITLDNKSLEQQQKLRNESAQLRPSWAPNHVESSKLARWLEPEQEKRGVDLALFFGPYTSQTLMQNLDFTFSHWDEANRELKIKAASQLVGVAYRLNYRKELNQMIEYSRGKQRICNVLSFNQLFVESCR